MNKAITIFLILFSFAIQCQSQKEAYNWYFGNKAALDFHTGQAVSMDNSEMLAFNGCASISDSSGILLFYSNGEKVWNSNHLVMPNGMNLNGYNGATQSALIVPSPQINGTYYLFTIGMYLGSGDNLGCYYSMIDMNADNGLGDIVQDQKNVFLVESDSATDVIMAISHANHKAFWIIIRDFSSVNLFKSYLLDDEGLHQSPISSLCLKNLTPNASRGTSKVSPDGKYYLFGGQGGSPQNPRQNELYRFDNSTGILTPIFSFSPDAIALASTFGAEFSANSDFLYLSTSHITWPMIWHSSVRQFDLSKLNSVNEFETSHVILYDEIMEHGFKQMQIGPDGKIYIAQADITSSHYLSYINFPSEAGLACNFEKNSVELISGNSIDGLPTFIQSYFVKFNWHGNCFGDSTYFSSWFLPEPESIQWEFGDPGSGPDNLSNLLNPAHLFSGPGTFIVIATAFYPNGRTESYEREVLITSYPVFELGEDQSICQGDEVTLSSGVILAQCLWNTGATTPSITVYDQGEYWLQVENNNGCIYRDTINVFNFPFPALDSTSLIISPTTCGGSTGAIRGLAVTGTDPISVEWKDVDGNVLETDYDIYDLPVNNYFFYATDGNGCTNLLEQFEITDAGEILIDTVVFQPSYCGLNNGSITITAVNGLGDMLDYSIDNGTNYIPNQWEFNNLPPDAYNIKVTDSSGCQAVWKHNPITIEDLSGPLVTPEYTSATGTNADGTVTLNASGYGVLIYTLENITQSTNVFTGLAAGTYHYRVEDENGCFTEGDIEVGSISGITLTAIAGNGQACMGTSIRVPVKVKNFTGVNGFSATLNYDPSNVDCLGLYPGSINVSLSGLDFIDYPAIGRIVATWNSNVSITIPDTALLFELVLKATNSGSSFVTWDQAPAMTWFTGEYGNIDDIEFTIGQVLAVNPPVITQDDPKVCEGDILWVSAIAQGTEPLTYAWELPNGEPYNSNFYVVISAKTTDAGQYKVRVTDPIGCADTAVFNVTVIPPPAANFPATNPTHDTIPFEQSYQLEATPGYASYEWNTGDTTYFITVTEEGEYSVIIQTAEGCTDTSAVMMVNTWFPVNVPNAFTPNSDGLNDVFKPVVDAEQVRQFSMSIYNRWGQLFFETNVASKGWDGKDALPGVYSWVITYSNVVGKIFKLKGSVVLIK